MSVLDSFTSRIFMEQCRIDIGCNDTIQSNFVETQSQAQRQAFTLTWSKGSWKYFPSLVSSTKNTTFEKTNKLLSVSFYLQANLDFKYYILSQTNRTNRKHVLRFLTVKIKDQGGQEHLHFAFHWPIDVQIWHLSFIVPWNNWLDTNDIK